MYKNRALTDFSVFSVQDVFAQPQAVPQAHNTVIYLKVTLMTMMIILIIDDIIIGDPIDCLPKNCLLVGNSKVGILWRINQQNCLP